MHDVRFYSSALKRQEVYRVVASTRPPPSGKLHVMYLLHGNGGSFRDWQANGPLAQYAAQGYLFVMPEGHSGYWVNSAASADARYEDYVTTDLIADAERGLAPDRDRSIAGVSMGGFGAVILALRHPGLYVFAGALSPPVDVPQRRFTWRRPWQSLAIRRIFGPYGSLQRQQRDPFWLVQHGDAACAPFLYIGSGVEPLAEPISRFARLLDHREFRYVYKIEPGGHDWLQWNRQAQPMLAAINQSAPACTPGTK